jgi:chromosome segregation ATPase
MTENTSNNQPPIEERLGRIGNAITELATGQQQILSLLGLVVTRLESIETDLGTVKAELGTVKAELGTVKAELGTVKAELGSVKARLDSIEADLGSVKTDVAILKVEMAEVKDDAKLRYVDLRERIMLNNDHLGVLDRTLRQLVKDLRQPIFPSADTR